MLKPCPMCDSLAENMPMPDFALTRIVCGKCGRYLLGDYPAETLPQDQSWPGTRGRLSQALRWASDRGTPALLKAPLDVTWLMGRFDMPEQDRTDQERRITEALVSAGEVLDVWTVPIHAVDRALTPRTSAESRKLVEDMLLRRVVQIRTRARNTLDPADPTPTLSWWEKGSSPPGGAAPIQGPA
jgi:hypothetical protein